MRKGFYLLVSIFIITLSLGFGSEGKSDLMTSLFLV